ncbi:MAG TPA: hypothetical protein VHT05_06070 [Candidatus Elarobacter sp.]|nr:hypothetical protein [Candidatus Elarobacter sp.]
MIRLGTKVFSWVLAVSFATSLAGCGGAGSRSALPPAGVVPNGAAQYTGPLADATFQVTIPPPKTSGKQRAPQYVSPSTSKIVFTLNTATRLSAAQVTSFNGSSLGTFAVTLNSATCPGSGPWTCTLTIKLPPGTDNLTISAQDSASSILSQQIQNFTVTAGASGASTNHFSTTLDANTTTMTIGTTSGFCAGSFNVAANQTVPTVGTAALTFNASYKDLAGNAFTNPTGKPILSVNGHTDDNGGSGYSISGSGGNVTVKVNQSTQSYTLQATTSSTTATINVASTPANTNTPTTDGLSFNNTLTYTFQSGTAPPASLLAAIEQTGAASGKIDLFTINTVSNTFAAASPSTLASTNPGAGPDVDFPQDLLFDTNGDLLIANGGAGSPDFGNFACVPAGAITTGANAATVLTNNMNDPKFIEIGADSSVALGNVPASSGTKTPAFVLNGTYAAASANFTITNTDYPGLGVTGLVAVPASVTHPAGSYAATLTNGSTTSHVVVKHPDGTVLQIDNANLVAPSLGIDTNASPNQLVAASKNGSHSYINFFNLLTGALIKQFVIQDTGCYSGGTTPYAGCPPNTASGFSNMKADITAVSSSGYVAVSGITSSGEPEVQVYDNTSNRNQVGGPIPYDATTTSGGATWDYSISGGSSPNIIVHAMRWITGTKLLVSLETGTAATQGLYLYDVTQSGSGCVAPASTTGCYDANGNVYPNTVKLVGFQALSNIPLSVAYKP